MDETIIWVLPVLSVLSFFCMISVLSIGDLTKLTSHSCSLFLFMNGLCIKGSELVFTSKIALYLTERCNSYAGGGGW